MQEKSDDQRYAEAKIKADVARDLGGVRTVYSMQDAGQRRFPDFLVIGAQKAGTTWLRDNLNYHPHLWMSPIKEINHFNERLQPSPLGWEVPSRYVQVQEALEYFANVENPGRRINSYIDALEVLSSSNTGDDWYGAIFAQAPIDSVCGECTPDYCILPRGAVSHIRSLNAAMKPILMLRDPIERAWSHLRMVMRDDPTLVIDDSFLAYGLGSYLRRSNYPEMVKNWSLSDDDRSMLLLNYDDLATAPRSVLSRVCRHIGVAFDDDFFPLASSRIHAGNDMRMPQAFLATARETLRPIYDQLVEIFPPAMAWRSRHFA